MEIDGTKAVSRKETTVVIVCGLLIYVAGLLSPVPGAKYILWPRSFPFGAVFIVLLADIAWTIWKGRLVKSRRVRMYFTTVIYALSASFFSAFILFVWASQGLH